MPAPDFSPRDQGEPTNRSCSFLGGQERTVSRQYAQDRHVEMSHVNFPDPSEQMKLLKEISIYVRDMHWVTEKNMLLSESSMLLLEKVSRKQIAAQGEWDVSREQSNHSLRDEFLEALQAIEANRDQPLPRELSGSARGAPAAALQELSDRILAQQQSVDQKVNEQTEALHAMAKKLDWRLALSAAQSCQPVLDSVLQAVPTTSDGNRVSNYLERELSHLSSTSQNGTHGSWQANREAVVRAGSQSTRQLDETEAVEEGTKTVDESVESTGESGSRKSESIGGVRPSKRISIRGSYAEPAVATGVDYEASSQQVRSNVRARDLPDTRPWLEKMVVSNKFEMVFALLICLNALNMCVECEYEGLGTGHVIGIEGSQAKTSVGDMVFLIIGLTFSVVFTIEVLLKFIVLRCGFWKSGWNIFDFTLITIAWVDFLVGADLPINPMLLRLLRLFRLARLLRGLSQLEIFDNLSLMIRGIKGAAPVLIWVIVLVFPMIAAVAVAMNYILVDFIADESQPLKKRLDCYTYFGTFSRSMLSMFEVTFANWVPLCRFLVEHVDAKFALFFMMYKMVVGIAVVRVIYGVFLHVTFACATSDEDTVIAKKNREHAKLVRKLQHIFIEWDEANTGVLPKDVFIKMLQCPKVKLSLSALEIEIEDAELAFLYVDADKDGVVSEEDMVLSFERLRGSARACDLVGLISLTHELQSRTESAVDKALTSRVSSSSDGT